jgi:phosphoglycerate kinase
MIKSVRDVELAGKRVLVREDYNVPLADGAVRDDTRLRASLPTVSYLLEQGAAVILISHLGRPKGKVVPELALDPVAVSLSALLGREVRKLDDCVGPEVEEVCLALGPGEIVLLENSRFYSQEEENDPEFASQLAALCDLYVNDAFAAAHRAHASTEGVARAVRERGGAAVAGLLMERELEILGRLMDEPERPFVGVLGGAKVSGKIGIIERLLEVCDRLLIGGGMANTFFAGMGFDMAESLVEEGSIEKAQELLAQGRTRLVLPVDLVVADAFENTARSQTVAPDQDPAGWRALDVGPNTIATFESALGGARTVFWNGPLGVFEMERFAQGTFALAELLANMEITTVVGGGDVVAAVRLSGMADRFTHVSTGGGASLRLLEGRPLPGVQALNEI